MKDKEYVYKDNTSTHIESDKEQLECNHNWIPYHAINNETTNYNYYYCDKCRIIKTENK